MIRKPRGILSLFESALSNAQNQIISLRENRNIAESVNNSLDIETQSLVNSFKVIIRAIETKLAAEKQTNFNKS